MFTYLKPKNINDVFSNLTNTQILDLFYLTPSFESAQFCLEELIKREANQELLQMCYRRPISMLNYFKCLEQKGYYMSYIGKYMIECDWQIRGQ